MNMLVRANSLMAQRPGRSELEALVSWSIDLCAADARPAERLERLLSDALAMGHAGAFQAALAVAVDCYESIRWTPADRDLATLTRIVADERRRREWLWVEEVCELLNYTERHTRRLIASGDLVSRRWHGRRRVERRSVEKRMRYR